MNKLLILLVVVAGSTALPSGYGPHAPAPAKTPFNYGYEIDDGTGNVRSRQESSDAHGNVKGEYSLLLHDGRRRKVTYTAGPEGFVANVESNEQDEDLFKDVRMKPLPVRSGYGYNNDVVVKVFHVIYKPDGSTTLLKAVTDRNGDRRSFEDGSALPAGFFKAL